jgi:hypothetical protein
VVSQSCLAFGAKQKAATRRSVRAAH